MTRRWNDFSLLVTYFLLTISFPISSTLLTLLVPFLSHCIHHKVAIVYSFFHLLEKKRSQRAGKDNVCYTETVLVKRYTVVSGIIESI